MQDHNIESINLINFQLIRDSLIAFQNDDKDELFLFYDQKSKKRFLKLVTRGNKNSDSISNIKETAGMILNNMSWALV